MSNVPERLSRVPEHRQTGRPDEAEPRLEARAHAQPPSAPALHTLGARAYQAGDAARARAYFAAAVGADPTCADYHGCLGAAWQELGRPDEALACHREALRLDPAGILALTNLGVTLMALGRTAEATAHFVEAWRRCPEDAGVVCNLAAARRAAGAPREAMTLFREALRLDPGLAEAHNNLGLLLEAAGTPVEAEACYRQALHLNPRLVSAYLNLGQQWQRTGRPEPACRLYRQALGQNPHSWELHARLAEALLTCNRAQESLVACQRALALRPEAAEAHNHRGNACTALGWLDDAVGAYARAQELRPGWSVPVYNRGVALLSQGRLAEGLNSFRETLSLNPDDIMAHSTYAGALLYDSASDGPALLAEHRHWAKRHALVPAPAAHTNVPAAERRLRVGYVSPDFRCHAVAFFLEPLLAHHDPARFETFAYAEVPAPDATTARLRGLVAHWRDTPGLTDAELAARIRADGIDVLVDLAGHLAGNRLLTFTHRPAPVQVSYLGYPGTTGLDAIGYRLTDAVIDPPDEPSCYTEELVRLEPSFCCYAPPPAPPLAGGLPSEQAGVVTFGSLHKLEKLNDGVLDLWCELLRLLPTARLALWRHTLRGSTAQALQARFADRGIAATRVLVRAVEPVDLGHLRVYHGIDVALDSFPWSGHTTACEALWMGVPVVTLRGTRCAGRLTASVLHAVGLADLVADTPAAYRELAAALAADLPRRRNLRRGLRDRLRSSPLCAGPAFARRVEAAYRTLWRRWCAGATRTP